MTTNVAKQFSESVVRERETGTGSVRERESLAGHSEGEDSSPDDDVSSVTGTLTVVVVGWLVGSSPPTMCQHTHHKRALILMTVPVSVWHTICGLPAVDSSHTTIASGTRGRSLWIGGKWKKSTKHKETTCTHCAPLCFMFIDFVLCFGSSFLHFLIPRPHSECSRTRSCLTGWSFWCGGFCPPGGSTYTFVLLFLCWG